MVKVNVNDVEEVVRDFKSECEQVKKYNQESILGVPDDENDYKYFMAVMYCVAFYRKQGCTLSVMTIRDQLPMTLDLLVPENFEPMNYDLAVSSVIYEHKINTELIELFSRRTNNNIVTHLESTVDKIFNKCYNDGIMPFNTKEETIIGLMASTLNLMVPGRDGEMEPINPVTKLIHTIKKPKKYFNVHPQIINKIVAEALGGHREED